VLRQGPAILGLLCGLGSPAFASGLEGAASADALREEPRWLRVLAVRVEFQPDTLRTTTGDGTFESAFRFERPWAIDPLPHDSLYFADHLSFLDHYYGRVSNGRLRIVSEVWPRGAREAYRLDKPMWHYNWNQSRERTAEQLALLFQDAWLLADADPELEFFAADGQLRFDAFIVFHAGVGQDFGEDGTPHDIPSAYLISADLVGPDLLHQGAVHIADPLRQRPDGSWYNGGAGQIEAGLILPESENHEDFQHGLAGVLVLQFGHVIGLPNLYDGLTGRSVIGKWGLMDQGSANFRGLLPALPSAWTRLLMDWDEALLVDQDTDSLWVAALGSPGERPQILKVPLSEHEHLLIENRQRDPAERGWTWGRDRQGRWARLDGDYRLSFVDTLGVAGDSAGVLVEVGNLDFDLPGSGLLLWHVDERRTTAERIATNAVNNDPQRRGVALEEADGIEDIGQDYVFFSPRAGVALGGPDDAWRRINGSWGLVNPHLSYNNPEYSWRSEPSSDTNDGWVTGVRVHSFSDQGDSMRVSVHFELRPPFHGAALAPALDGAALPQARVQLFDFEAGPVLALLAGGESWARGLTDQAPPLWERGDGHHSLLPPAWQAGLAGLWLLPHPEGERLLVQRADSLALFRRMGDPARFTLEALRGYEGQPIQALAVLPETADGEDAWADGSSARIFAVIGQMVMELAPGDLSLLENYGNLAAGETSLVALRDGSGLPGILVRGPQPRLVLGGQLDANPPAGALELMALDAVDVTALPEGELRATALLRDAEGVTLYRGSEKLLRIDQPNLAARPLQAGDGTGLEIGLLTPDGDLAVYNLHGAQIARAAGLDAAPAEGAAWLTASRVEGRPLHWIAGPGHLTACEADGRALPSWPRVLPALVDGLHALPDRDWVLGLRPSGHIEAWETGTAGLVWGGPRGDANGGHRPLSTGEALAAPLPEVAAHPAFVWPNPAGEVAHFRFRLDGPARVVLSVFDMAGERRHRQEREFSQPGASEGEIVWQTAGVAPGGYFCVLEARPLGGGAGWTRTINCAVLR
jgi:M6 family metalloprotease-like protein